MDSEFIPVSNPDLFGNEEKYVVQALRSSWISSTGEYVERFEKEFSKFCGANYVIPVSNGKVGHDASIGSFNVINPGSNIYGRVKMGDLISVGTGTQVLEGLKIESDVTIGEGAVVTKHIESQTTVVGILAKPLVRNR